MNPKNQSINLTEAIAYSFRKQNILNLHNQSKVLCDFENYFADFFIFPNALKQFDRKPGSVKPKGFTLPVTVIAISLDSATCE